MSGNIFVGVSILGASYVLGVYGWGAAAVASGSAPPSPPIPITWLFYPVLITGGLVLDVLHHAITQKAGRGGGHDEW